MFALTSMTTPTLTHLRVVTPLLGIRVVTPLLGIRVMLLRPNPLIMLVIMHLLVVRLLPGPLVVPMRLHLLPPRPPLGPLVAPMRLCLLIVPTANHFGARLLLLPPTSLLKVCLYPAGTSECPSRVTTPPATASTGH